MYVFGFKINEWQANGRVIEAKRFNCRSRTRRSRDQERVQVKCACPVGTAVRVRRRSNAAANGKHRDGIDRGESHTSVAVIKCNLIAAREWQRRRRRRAHKQISNSYKMKETKVVQDSKKSRPRRLPINSTTLIGQQFGYLISLTIGDGCFFESSFEP